MAQNLIKIIILLFLLNSGKINSKPLIETTTSSNDEVSTTTTTPITTTSAPDVETTTSVATTTELVTETTTNSDTTTTSGYSSNESSFSDEHLQTTSSTFNFESSEENKSANFKSFENFKFPESLESTVSSEEQSTSIVIEHKESDTKNYHYTTNVKKEPVGGNSVNSTPSSSTKKAKSLDVDDAMNANTNIPDYTEVWALASGLWAPNNTRKAQQYPQSSHQMQTTDDYLNVNQETSNSPESLLVKWSEVMKIMNNKTTTDNIGNQSKRVFANNELNEDDKVIKPSIPLSTSTLAPNLDNNRIDLDNQEQRINETIVLERPKNHNYQIAPKTIDKTVEIFDVTSVTNRKIEQLRVSEPESTLDVETMTTTEIIETTTETDVSELSTESNDFTTTEEPTTDFMDMLDNEKDEPDDEMIKRTAPTESTTTEIPSTTEKPVQTTTELNPSINEIPESTERYNKSSSTPQRSSSISVSSVLISTAMPRSLEMTDSPVTEAPEISTTTTSNIIEFKPVSSDSPIQTKVLQNDTNNYEYTIENSTVIDKDLLPQSSSTVFTAVTPPSTTFSYKPKISIPGNRNEESTSTTDNSIYQDEEPMNVTNIVIISICVACAVIFILIAVFLVFMKKRKSQLSNIQRCKPVNLDQYSLDNISVYNSVRRKPNAMRQSKRSFANAAFEDPSLQSNSLDYKALIEFVKNKNQIYDEFKDIPQVSIRVDEIPEGCEDKNRYANIVPFPETRVYLKRLSDDDEKSEYINANYITGPKDAFSYIATQAPLENTISDFWRMIWEKNSKVIVCLTDLTEEGVEKCAEYIPPSTIIDNNRTFGDFQVTLKSREVKENYAVSTIHLKNSSTQTWREIIHLWYDWPEKGCPADINSVIGMLLEARAHVRSSLPEQLDENSNSETIEKADKLSTLDKTKSLQRTQGPLTVHCSPGTGRTGTVIACDIILRQLETPPRKIDVPQIVYLVRRSRSHAIRARDQYEFIYKVASTYATKLSNPSIEN